MKKIKLTIRSLFCSITLLGLLVLITSCSKNDDNGTGGIIDENAVICYNCVTERTDTATPEHPNYPRDSTIIFEACGTLAEIEAVQETEETTFKIEINGTEYTINRVDMTECK